jgi:magnesium chelatase subunit I
VLEFRTPTVEPIGTVGELRRALNDRFIRRASVKDEVRHNLICKMKAGEDLFPGVIGYDDTVVPQLVNAILSRHNFILLGLREQAKTRILRSLVGLLDEVIPVVAGCEINDDPLDPICPACRARLAREGDEVKVAWLPRKSRTSRSSQLPMSPSRTSWRHRSDQGGAAGSSFRASSRSTRPPTPGEPRLFAINELPDLAGKIQVGLFNILQEGDVQIKGYPIRLRLDVLLVFTANPEDYTARGKIITPLKDRIGSEIRTHYPVTRHLAMSITAQEAWLARHGRDLSTEVPSYVREVVEEIAFQARTDKRIDKRSGVSQRLPITCIENVVSNAERRALLGNEKLAVARVTDVYAALPSITGKFELDTRGSFGAEPSRAS